ncbi:hypothetical protein ACM614_19455 [Streptomyces sp. 12297]|uniref:hypothetical protein n=1 Tax=Streptomyces sp. NBC_00239 TaxID=2903640 RepID=UPI002E28A29C|nr:hypothetical protein [Streptomyces sp. NBC_00239]
MDAHWTDFARAPLDGALWDEAMNHPEDCPRCRPVEERPSCRDFVLVDGRGRMAAVAFSAGTVLAAGAATLMR